MEQYNPGQIKKFLKQLRQREEQYIYYLGQLAFQAGEEGGLSRPEMLEAYRTLKDIKTQTAQWETLLAQLKAAKEVAQRPRCPRCGGEVVKGALYCPSCGGALAAPVQPGMPAAPGGTAPAAPLAPPPPVPGAAVPVPPGAAVMPSPVPGQPAVAGTPAQAPVTGPAAPPPAQAATPVPPAPVARTEGTCGPRGRAREMRRRRRSRRRRRRRERPRNRRRPPRSPRRRRPSPARAAGRR